MRSTKNKGNRIVERNLKRKQMLSAKGNENPLWLNVIMAGFVAILLLLPLTRLVSASTSVSRNDDLTDLLDVPKSSHRPMGTDTSSNSEDSEDRIIINDAAELISEPEAESLMTAQEIVEMSLGDSVIETELGTLKKYSLPTVFYPGLDFSSFQGYMSWRMITDPSSEAYKVISDDRMYIDKNGMCRFQTSEDQFTIDGQDDYVIALGTYYKEKGTCGSRWLVVTTTGAYTAITGDEKDNADTDVHNMFVFRKDGSSTGIVEWIVDYDLLNEDIALHGTVTRGPIEAAQGEILYMYRID